MQNFDQWVEQPTYGFPDTVSIAVLQWVIFYSSTANNTLWFICNYGPSPDTIILQHNRYTQTAPAVKCTPLPTVFCIKYRVYVNVYIATKTWILWSYQVSVKKKKHWKHFYYCDGHINKQIKSLLRPFSSALLREDKRQTCQEDCNPI